MYTIELVLRGNPLPLSVQRKETSDAEALYQKIMAALQSSTPQTIELTCDRQPEKRIAILSNEVVAVQLSDKASSGVTSRAADFFGLGQ